MRRERVHRVRHVRVTQVPAFVPARIHGAVVRLRVGDEPGVLLGVEAGVRVLGPSSPPPLQLHELGPDLLLARVRLPRRGGLAIDVGLGAEVVEAGVALAGPLRGIRVYRIQPGHHLPHGVVKAVQVHAVEARPLLRRHRGVVGAHPGDQLLHLPVAPHPPRESLEVAQGASGVRVLPVTPHERVDTEGGRPVGLHHQRVEALFGDEAAGEGGACLVELVCPVCGLAQQDEPRITDALDERVQVRSAARHGERGGSDALQQGGRHLRGVLLH